MVDFAIQRGLFRHSVKRVVRGGSWINNGHNLRSANRNGIEADNANNNVGFRLVLSFANIAEKGHSIIGKPKRTPCYVGSVLGAANCKKPHMLVGQESFDRTLVGVLLELRCPK